MLNREPAPAVPEPRRRAIGSSVGQPILCHRGYSRAEMRIHGRTDLFVCMAFAFVACSPTSSDDDPNGPDGQTAEERGTHAAVIGRVGASPAVELLRSNPIEPLMLGGETRSAFELPPGNPLGVVVEKTARQVMLSVGVVGNVKPPSPVRFIVRAKTTSGWQTVFFRRPSIPA